MSSRVTSVPDLQWPLDDGPGWHTSVKAPATTTSPFTIAVDSTSVLEQLPPNHCEHAVELVVPANTFGVQDTSEDETTPERGTAAPAGATPNMTRLTHATGTSNAIRARPRMAYPSVSSGRGEALMMR